MAIATVSLTAHCTTLADGWHACDSLTLVDDHLSYCKRANANFLGLSYRTAVHKQEFASEVHCCDSGDRVG